MTDEELTRRLRSACFLAFDDGTNDYGSAPAAADRIEALVKDGAEWATLAADYNDKFDAQRKRAERLEAAIDYILDGMAISAPDYEIDPDDEFLDAADNDWVRDVLTRLAAAMKGADHD